MVVGGCGRDGGRCVTRVAFWAGEVTIGRSGVYPYFE
jgi:hypothetical protein